MSDRSQMLYLLHAERRLLDQVYRRRYHPVGLSWESALQWTQQETERIRRLLDLEILYEAGGCLRLSPLIHQFWEQWEETGTGDYSLKHLLADWQNLREDYLLDRSNTGSQQVGFWIRQLIRWQKLLPVWEEESLLNEALAHQLIPIATAMEEDLEGYFSTRAGTEPELDRQLSLWLESLQINRRSRNQNKERSDIHQQIILLQSLRRKNLLFRETNLLNLLAAQTALLWEESPEEGFWPA